MVGIVSVFVVGFAGTAGQSSIPGIRLEVDPCDECSLNLALEQAIGEAGEPLPGAASAIDRLADGRLIAVFSNRDYEAVVYSADGKHAEVVGRRGEGPGEYRWIRWIKRQGRFVHLIDPAQRRVTVLDADFNVVRETPYPVPTSLFGAEVVNDSVYVVNGRFHTRDRAGFWLHAFGKSGVIRSFDEATEVHPLSATTAEQGIYRVLERSRDGSLWAANRHRYEIDRWDPLTGRRLQRLVREADWFPGHGRRRPIDPSTPPPPVIVDIAEDPNGLLLVMIVKPSANWADHVVLTSPGASGRESEELAARRNRYSMDGRAGAWQTVVEVIDPRTGRVVTTSSVDTDLRVFLSDGRALSYHTNEAGVPHWRVWRIEMVGQWSKDR